MKTGCGKILEIVAIAKRVDNYINLLFNFYIGNVINEIVYVKIYLIEN